MNSLIENDDKNDIFLEISDDKKNNLKYKNIIKKDVRIIKLQENLLMMGFDIDMINKVIMHFNIRTENEAIDYLIKSDDGFWHHPFIKIKEEENQKDEVLNNNLIDIDNVINKVKTMKFSKDICQICGESIETHINDNLKEQNFEELEFNNNNLFNNFERNDNKIDDKKCKICLDDIVNPVEMEKCKHKFCRECFTDYLNNLINQNDINDISCPEEKCTDSLDFNFFSQYLSEDQLIKYNQLKTRNEISRDKLKIFCPLCNSYAKIDSPNKYDPNNKSYIKSKLVCQKGHEFCSCGRPQHEGECYHDGEEFKNLIIKEKIKNCPKCGFLIKKNSGCNHMTCGNKSCKFEFCWLCLQESLPGHYEAGPCSGMQFVDPDSIFYQLEQKYPFLYYVFLFLRIIIIIICFSLFLCFPALLLWILMAFILYENYLMEDTDEDKLYTLSKSLNITHFIISIPILLSVQTILYVSLVIIIAYFAIYILYLLLCLLSSLFS